VGYLVPQEKLDGERIFFSGDDAGIEEDKPQGAGSTINCARLAPIAAFKNLIHH
jgi:hypothetical protein